jgi:hypothetical protein
MTSGVSSPQISVQLSVLWSSEGLRKRFESILDKLAATADWSSRDTSDMVGEDEGEVEMSD